MLNELDSPKMINYGYRIKDPWEFQPKQPKKTLVRVTLG